MPIKLPDFKNPFLFWATLCGQLNQADDKLQKWLAEEPEKEADFETSRGTGRVRLIFGGRLSKHLHIDVISPEIAANAKPKKKSAKLSELQETLDRFLGMEVQCNVAGGFKIELGKIPEAGIIRSLMFSTKTGNVAIKLNGASFAIEGAPVNALTWNASQGENIAITLEAEDIKTVVSEDYLVNNLSIAEQAFDVFVLGRGQNEQK